MSMADKMRAHKGMKLPAPSAAKSPAEEPVAKTVASAGAPPEKKKRSGKPIWRTD